MKTLLSWSSGKDSAWALYQLQQDEAVELKGLFTTINEEADRVAMHAVRRELLELQAQAAGLPVDIIPLPYPCSNDIYEQVMTEFIRSAIDRGVECFAFGDLHLEDVRRYREKQFVHCGIALSFPIWGRDTRELATEMLASGMRAQITCVDPKQIAKSFAGREFDQGFLRDLPAEVDPCGENGEFHSFAFAGPMFCSDIPVSVGDTVERDGFVFTDLLPADKRGDSYA